MDALVQISELKFKDGFVPINGAKIYYKLFESRGSKMKAICLHGGPGGSHDYILPLAKLSKRGITTLFYDQYASGRSDETPDYLSRFTVDYYVDEVEQVRKNFFHDEKVFVLGHSWGGILALSYALKYQQHLKGLIACSGLSTVQGYLQNVNRLRDAFPARIRKVMDKYEKLGDYTNPEYLKAVDHFNRKHLLRLNKWSKEALKTMEYLQARKPYLAIQGPNEFTVSGTMKDFEITAKLDQIRVPTLITCGSYDEAGYYVQKPIHDAIKGSKLVIFENSAHMLMWEKEANKWLKTIEDFIKENA